MRERMLGTEVESKIIYINQQPESTSYLYPEYPVEVDENGWGTFGDVELDEGSFVIDSNVIGYKTSYASFWGHFEIATEPFVGAQTLSRVLPQAYDVTYNLPYYHQPWTYGETYINEEGKIESGRERILEPDECNIIIDDFDISVDIKLAELGLAGINMPKLKGEGKFGDEWILKSSAIRNTSLQTLIDNPPRDFSSTIYMLRRIGNVFVLHTNLVLQHPNDDPKLNPDKFQTLACVENFYEGLIDTLENNTNKRYFIGMKRKTSSQ